MGNRPIIFVNTNNYPVFCDNRCANTECSRHISKLYQHSGGAKISKLRDTGDCEGYISRRQQKNNKCELCGKSCRERTTIKNRINGKELKICNECMGKFQFEQETEGTGNGK